MAPKGRSVAWDHFIDKGGSIAECKICKNSLSFKSSVSNLTKHLKKKHPLVDLVRRNASEEQAQLPSQIPAAAAVVATAVPASSQPPSSSGASGTVRVLQGSAKTISSYIYKRNAEKSKSDIDELIMNLFILDFQPFRLVEMKGFRKLMNTAFPFYIIPSRKYFANNLLPGKYESLRAEKMEEMKRVESVCITADMWTSCTCDSYMAITGHYINENGELTSVMFECVLLEGAHTSAYIAAEILSILEEWGVKDKVILAVSDNGANIKKALENDLGLKHFGCYAHTLNLAVQEALSTPEITDLIERLKQVVRYFKKSTLGWTKLKKYQEQAGKIPKRPLQSVPTRWNSTYFMLQRLLEIKEEINSALSNLNVNIVRITSTDWDACANICTILKPCVDVTKEVSAEKYITGSIVIPITTGLLSALDNINSNNYSTIGQNLLQDLISVLKRRFANLHRSRTFTKCMFLDPRFKLYFEDQNLADSTKQNIIQLVTSLIHKEDDQAVAAAPTPTVAATPTPTLPATPSTSASTTVAVELTTSVWAHYRARMLNIQPKGTATSRSILEVQRYLEEKNLLPEEKISPLEWWKERRNIYPHLFHLAMRNLNAMATSVPCERIFSACGRLINERRTRLGCRKVQQLMFLHQNY